MSNQPRQIIFNYKGETKGPYIHDLNDKMKEPCLKFTQEINKNIESLFFLLNGCKLSKGDLDKPISIFMEDKTEMEVIACDISSNMLNTKVASNDNDNLIDNDKHSNIQISNAINNNPSPNNQNVDFQNNNNQYNINDINQNNNNTNTNDNTDNPLSTDTVRILNIDVNQVSVKATTYEKMGFIGRGEAIACEAVCLVENND